MFDSERPNANTEKKDLQDLKKKRDEYAAEARKQKIDDILQKKRARNLEIAQNLDEQIIQDQNSNIDRELRDCILKWNEQIFNMDQLMELIEAAHSSDRYKQHYGVIGLRKIVCTDNPPIQAVIDANMVPKFIRFMQNEHEPHLQMEAAWVLSTIASGTSQQTQSIIDKGGIPCFIQLLKSNHKKIAERAIQALGNISGDSSNFRDVILKRGGLIPLMQIVSNTEDPTLIKDGIWAISNLCRGRPLPDIKFVEAAIPILCAVLKKETDQAVLVDAAWALSYCMRSNVHINTVIESGVIPDLVRHLETTYRDLLIPCLRILGNITPENANAVLCEQNFLPRLFRLTQHETNAIRRESFWAISNIAAGTAEQIALLLEDPDSYRSLVHGAENGIEDEVQREAVWALSNATKNAGVELIETQIEYGALDCFLRLLSSKDSRTVKVSLEGISNILNWGENAAKQNNSPDNEFLILFEVKGGVVKIEELQSHPDHEVYSKVVNILETYFELQDVL